MLFLYRTGGLAVLARFNMGSRFKSKCLLSTPNTICTTTLSGREPFLLCTYYYGLATVSRRLDSSVRDKQRACFLPALCALQSVR